MKKMMILAAMAAGCWSAFGAVRAATPTMGNVDWRANWWVPRHREKMNIVTNGGAKVVFIGDSITHYWETNGRAQLAKYFSSGDWKMLDLGVGGDCTEHVLWRIVKGGELDGYEARFVNLMIGTNNAGGRSLKDEPTEATVLGIKTILEEILRRQPKAIVVLNAIFPRGLTAADGCRRRNDAVNAEIRKLADGKRVFWCDFADRFMDRDGNLDTKMFCDTLHPTAAGYEVWYEEIKPFVEYALSDRTGPAPAARVPMFGRNGKSAVDGLKVGVVSSMESVRPRVGYKVKKAEPVKLRMARNEYESFQVLVSSSEGELKDARVEFAPLKGGKNEFAAENFKCSPVGYVQTTNVPPYVVRPTCQKPELGWWPDAILDFTNRADVAEGDVQSFWIRVKCPENQKPGVYEGVAKVRATQDGHEICRELPVSVRVNKFVLPKKSMLPLAITFGPGVYIKGKCCRKGETCIHNSWKNHTREYADFLADYFITWDSLYVNGGAEPKWEGLKLLKEEDRLGMFNLHYFWCAGTNEAGIARFKKNEIAKYRKNYDKAKELGLLDHAYFYGCDELGKNHFPAISNAVNLIHREFPDVKLMTTCRDGKLGVDGSILAKMDMFCPASCFWNPAQVKKARAAGREVWWYFCCDPSYPLANTMVETPPIEIRSFMGAQTIKYRPDGFLYYETAAWKGNGPIMTPFYDWDAQTCGQYHGDGQWTCCGGPDMLPLPTLRLENFRDGLEDYAYAKLLEEKLAKCKDPTGEWAELARAALAVPTTLVRDLSSFSINPEELYAWRDRIADLLERDGPFPRGSSDSPEVVTARFTFDSPETLMNDTGSGAAEMFATGNPLWDERGVRGGCVYFDGKSWLSAKSVPAGLPKGDEESTVSAWIRADGVPPWGNGWVSFGDKAKGRGNSLSLLGPTKVHNYWNECDLTVNSESVGDGQWHHVVATARAGRRAVFVDGILCGSDKASPNTGTGVFLIGRTMHAGAFKGWVDELQIWKRAFTDEEVFRLYKNELSPAVIQRRPMTRPYTSRTLAYEPDALRKDGFTVTFDVDLAKVKEDETLYEAGPLKVVLRLAGKEKYDNGAGNYIHFPMPDGTCPVIEAKISPKGGRVGIPLACLKNPEGVHRVTLNLSPVVWTIRVDDRMDEDFPHPSAPIAWEERTLERICSPRVTKAEFVSPARKDALPPEPDAKPIAGSLQYWTPEGHDTWVGDVAPGTIDGKLHVFYLIDRRHHGSGGGVGRHQFAHIASDDLVNWVEHPLAVPIRETWQTVGTGTPFKKDGKLAIAFGWHTDRLPGTSGKPIGGTYAISDDGIHFRNSGHVFTAAQNPSVYNLPEGGYELVTSYGGPVGIYRSADMNKWTCHDAKLPFQGDCAALFDWHGHRYLIQGFVNMAYSEDGSKGSFVNWTKEPDKLYDGLSVPMVVPWKDDRRIYIGWLGSLHGWGGWLVFREVVYYPDGRLGLKWVPEIKPPTAPETYSAKGGEVFTKSFTSVKDPKTEIVLTVDPAKHEAMWWDGKNAAKPSFRIGGVRGIDQDYVVKIIAHYDAKSDVTIFDAEIAGQRTVIAKRSGKFQE